MAGHSKWSNIKRRKAKVDAQRSRIFTRLGREIMVAVRHGGPDSELNFALRLAIDRARAANMPNDNILRVIQRASGTQEDADLEEIVYEGYGPGGVAIMIELLTDNRNRTAAEIRHIFSRHGGNLGENGCVAWMFSQKGCLVLERDGLKKNTDDVIMDALDAGADDVQEDEQSIEILTEPAYFAEVEGSLVKRGYRFAEAKICRIPQMTVKLDRNGAEKILNLLEELEEQEDVQEVYSNFDIPDDILAEFAQ
ncbi:MAG TPA: YebC/PmpR family DNA-binding transcriptional regulator [bacterium]|jgi:YebC/PmpR family DNA-binding regulatory protein|nr:YebC/PmpR family DNA-binding transcriptional regulator [bacterium]